MTGPLVIGPAQPWQPGELQAGVVDNSGGAEIDAGFSSAPGARQFRFAGTRWALEALGQA